MIDLPDPVDHRARLRRLRARMAEETTQALLVTHGADVLWLCGFSGSNAMLLVYNGAAVLLTDGRYTTQAREETAGARVRVMIAKKLPETAVKLLLRAGVSTVSFDAQHTSVAGLDRLHAALPEQFTKAQRRRFFHPLAAPLVSRLREEKDAGELAVMEEAALLGCRILQAALPHLAAGVGEREFAAELEYIARTMGADGMSFPTIVASGKRSALPHGTASAAPLPRRGFVTLDFGIMHKGYCSDMTRTVYLGKPTRAEREAYAAVLAAEEAGIAAVRPGIGAAKVDAAARSVLRKAGLAKYFTHSTGHGVGMEIHEGPRLGAKAADVLREGMVVTIEPGVYLPGQFGIRIEDMVVVEAGGARVLTPAPKELLLL